MRRSTQYKRTSQRSVPFFGFRSRDLDLPEHYVQMFQEDIYTAILPMRGWSPTSKFQINVTPADASVETIIALALPGEYGRNSDIHDAVTHFFERTSHYLTWYGKVLYEIAFDYDENPKPVAFRLVHVPKACIHDATAFYWQFISPARRKELGVPNAAGGALRRKIDNVRLIPKNRMLAIGMPSELGGRRALMRTIRALSCASRSSFPELAISEMNYSGPKCGFDFAVHRKETELHVARATRLFGWPMRSTAEESTLEFYRLHRYLRFERTKIIIRDHILDRLNDALRRAGKELGFDVRIALSGERTRQQCEDALRGIQSGSMQLKEAWEILKD